MRLNCKGAGTGLTPDAEVPGAVPLHPLRPSERSVRSQRSRPEKGPRQPALKSWARDRHLGRGVAKKPFVVAGTVRSGRFEGRSGSERSTEHGRSTKPLHRGHGLTTLSLPGRLKRKSWFIAVFPWKRLGRRGSRGSGIADEIQSDPSTRMSAMFAWAGLHLGISYEAELRCLRPEIRPSGTGVLCGCNVLRLRIGGTVERSSCCLSLVAGILDMGLGACDHGRTNSYFSLDLSVLSNHVPAPGPSFRSYVTRVRYSSLPT